MIAALFNDDVLEVKLPDIGVIGSVAAYVNRNVFVAFSRFDIVYELVVKVSYVFSEIALKCGSFFGFEGNFGKSGAAVERAVADRNESFGKNYRFKRRNVCESFRVNFDYAFDNRYVFFRTYVSVNDGLVRVIEEIVFEYESFAANEFDFADILGIEERSREIEFSDVAENYLGKGFDVAERLIAYVIRVFEYDFRKFRFEESLVVDNFNLSEVDSFERSICECVCADFDECVDNDFRKSGIFECGRVYDRNRRHRDLTKVLRVCEYAFSDDADGFGNVEFNVFACGRIKNDVGHFFIEEDAVLGCKVSVVFVSVDFFESYAAREYVGYGDISEFFGNREAPERRAVFERPCKAQPADFDGFEVFEFRDFEFIRGLECGFSEYGYLREYSRGYTGLLECTGTYAFYVFETDYFLKRAGVDECVIAYGSGFGVEEGNLFEVLTAVEQEHIICRDCFGNNDFREARSCIEGLIGKVFRGVAENELGEVAATFPDCRSDGRNLIGNNDAVDSRKRE